MMAARLSIFPGGRLVRLGLCRSSSHQQTTLQSLVGHSPRKRLMSMQPSWQNTVLLPRRPVSHHCFSTAMSRDQLKSDEQIESQMAESQTSAAEQFTNLDPKQLQRLKRHQLEYEVTQATGKQLPDMNDERWLEILQECPTQASRRKKYHYWHKRDIAIASMQKKKAARRLLLDEQARENAEEQEGHLVNRIMHNVIDATIIQHHYNNLAYAMQFGDKLVFDLSFDARMTKKENINLVQQLLKAHHYNKIRRDPFHWILTSCPRDHPLYQRKGINFDRIPITITEKHYLDILPKEKLVYLSPNSPNVLRSYDSDDIYIIGGIVDTAEKLPLTYAKAKREGIRTAQLPLDIHLKWGQGHKCLTLDQMMGIMLEVKDSRDWLRAFQFIPSRKLK